ncbi:hypothetical protein L9F63_014912, partial [Diploptera punctata]
IEDMIYKVLKEHNYLLADINLLLISWNVLAFSTSLRHFFLSCANRQLTYDPIDIQRIREEIITYISVIFKVHLNNLGLPNGLFLRVVEVYKYDHLTARREGRKFCNE